MYVFKNVKLFSNFVDFLDLFAAPSALCAYATSSLKHHIVNIRDVHTFTLDVARFHYCAF